VLLYREWDRGEVKPKDYQQREKEREQRQRMEELLVTSTDSLEARRHAIQSYFVGSPLWYKQQPALLRSYTVTASMPSSSNALPPHNRL